MEREGERDAGGGEKADNGARETPQMVVSVGRSEIGLPSVWFRVQQLSFPLFSINFSPQVSTLDCVILRPLAAEASSRNLGIAI